MHIFNSAACGNEHIEALYFPTRLHYTTKNQIITCCDKANINEQWTREMALRFSLQLHFSYTSNTRDNTNFNTRLPLYIRENFAVN